MLALARVNSNVRHLSFSTVLESGVMQRITLHLSVLVITFIVGVMVSKFVHREHRSRAVTVATVPLSGVSPRFIPVGSLVEREYHIYWYKTPASSDPEEITLYGDFRSARTTREHFESNATTTAAKLISLGSKFDENGQKIGKRGVTVFTGDESVRAFRIFWTEGDVFWSVQAPTLELAREFEESGTVHSITMSNKSLDASGGSASRN